ncbi:hypothetical protein CLUG_05688 [Clavispora lusitaniae ATCC 42720]|uniref:Uncharacterized protein n=1 Tax=Clavispora lusitaniae (strain ATCC 42720) TaxID=306902 RepID=C4YBW0_CLAL4|nr:uncharacterized protein CLUG_05688 [Clavispora lusitaniae ATCC 42720]EEQ41559.1 hypothetical protein CLUG_05688 [Clavispora lusitaniae ATCC 42720]
MTEGGSRSIVVAAALAVPSVKGRNTVLEAAGQVFTVLSSAVLQVGTTFVAVGVVLRVSVHFGRPAQSARRVVCSLLVVCVQDGFGELFVDARGTNLGVNARRRAGVGQCSRKRRRGRGSARGRRGWSRSSGCSGGFRCSVCGRGRGRRSGVRGVGLDGKSRGRGRFQVRKASLGQGLGNDTANDVSVGIHGDVVETGLVENLAHGTRDERRGGNKRQKLHG